MHIHSTQNLPFKNPIYIYGPREAYRLIPGAVAYGTVAAVAALAATLGVH